MKLKKYLLPLLAASFTSTGVYAQSATKFTIPSGAATASTYDTKNNAVPGNSVDGSLSTRWAGQGDGAYITYDLASTQSVQYIKIAWYQGNTRTETFDVLSADSTSGPWNYLLSGKVSSGTSTSLETYDFPDTKARYIRIVGHGNSAGNGWNSVTETQLWGTASNQAAKPSLSPGGGTYTNAQSVTIKSSTSGATIRYTTDGNKPTPTTGTVYTGPVSIAASTTLKAIAYKSGTTNSTVASGNYVIDGSSGGGGGGGSDGGGSGSDNLNPSAPPSSNFDLSKFKLTIPSGSDIATSTLNSGYTLANAFYTDPVTGGMVFRTLNIGGTTSGSTYSRTELREMLNESAGTTELGNNWVLGSSSSSAKAEAAGVDGTMTATLTVDHASTTGDSTKVGRLIVGQIHGPETEVIRLYYHKRPSDAKGAIYFGHDTPSNSNTYYPIIGDPDHLNPANGIALGERWSYEIKVVGNLMTVKVTPQGKPTVTTSLTLESGYNDQYLYYKAGIYNQNNTGSSDDYSQATFYSLSHIHP